MARDLKAKIRIEADTQNADKNIKRLGTTSKKAFDQVEKGSTVAAGGVGKLGAGMAVLALKAGALLGGLTLLTRGIKGAFSAAIQQENAIRKLDAALVTLGPNADAVSEALQKQASALQRVTTFGDESIIEAQALISAFVKEEGQIKELTRVTLDFAEAKGVSLKTAADLITKTFASSTNALTRYGLEVEGTAGSTERLVSITNALDSAFKGAAEAGADTFSGKLKSLANVLGDVGERLAETITRSNNFGEAIDKLTDFFRRVEGRVVDTSLAISNFGLIAQSMAEDILPKWAASLVGVDGATLRLGDALIKTKSSMNESSAAAQKLNDQQKELAKSAADVTAAEKALNEEREEAKKVLDELNKENERYLGVLRELGLISEKTTDSLQDNANTLRDVTRAFDEGRISQDQYLDQYERLQQANIDLVEATNGSSRAIRNEQIPAVDAATSALLSERDAVNLLVEADDRLTTTVIDGARQRTEARAAEASAASPFTGSNIAGGTFTINPSVIVEPNGRVRSSRGLAQTAKVRFA